MVLKYKHSSKYIHLCSSEQRNVYRSETIALFTQTLRKIHGKCWDLSRIVGFLVHSYCQCFPESVSAFTHMLKRSSLSLLIIHDFSLEKPCVCIFVYDKILKEHLTCYSFMLLHLNPLF